MKRYPTADEQFGVFDENDEFPTDDIAEELGTSGYVIKVDPNSMSVEEDDDA